MTKDKKSETRVIVEEISDENTPKIAEHMKDIATESVTPITNKETEPLEKEIENNTNKPVVGNKSSANFNIFWIILPGIMLLGLLMGGIIAYFSGINKLKSSETSATIKPTSQPVITIEPSPSTSPISKIDLTKYKIKVLNGSGIKGEAGKVQALLEKAGFIIESTGNASRYDYTNTVIQAKEGVDKAFIDQLEKDLSKTYKLDKRVVLKDTETSSVIIIVGSSKS